MRSPGVVIAVWGVEFRFGGWGLRFGVQASPPQRRREYPDSGFWVWELGGGDWG